MSAATTRVGTCKRVSQSRIASRLSRFERGLCPRSRMVWGRQEGARRQPRDDRRKGAKPPPSPAKPPSESEIKEFFADAVGMVPDVRLQEAELLVDLELGDQRVDLLV